MFKELKEIGKIMCEQSKNIIYRNYKNQIEILEKESTITKMKNSQQRFNSRF